MKRNLKKLASEGYDLVIIGGGIYGAFAAWDAALRGLSVALLEKGDFGGATSSNSLKIIHGGLRYLQHADFTRMRESIRERRILMSIAPHLVHPLPCIMPTYGHGLKGREVMAAALMINDLVGFDRNRLMDPQKHLPDGRLLSRQEILELAPGLDNNGLTGGALWYDCQTYNSERLLLAVLHSAVAAGAQAANYAEVTGFLGAGRRITGVRVTDRLTSDTFEIRAQVVLNSSGPWVDRVLGLLNGLPWKSPTARKFIPSQAMNLVVRRIILPNYAMGVSSRIKSKRADGRTARAGRGGVSENPRVFFITPWHNYSLIGTTHLPYTGDVESFRVTERDVQDLIAQVNAAYPPAAIRREELTHVYAGLLPMASSRGAPVRGEVTLVKHFRIHDHRVEDGLDGLLTVIGVKYTTARDVAAKSISAVCKKLGRPFPPSVTHQTPVYGGNIERFDECLSQEMARQPDDIEHKTMRHLIHTYGTAYPQILRYARQSVWILGQGTARAGELITTNSPVLRAEVLFGIREEMAQKLSDVVLRRTELGAGGYPGDAAVLSCAEIMRSELGWDDSRVRKEIEELRLVYQPIQ